MKGKEKKGKERKRKKESERDKYIEALCCKFPKLIENYNLLNNKGYGTKYHIDMIKKFGRTKYHRKSFQIKSNQQILQLN